MTLPLQPENKAQEDFLDEYARRTLVEWAARDLVFDDLDLDKEPAMLVAFAAEKGWLSKREPRSITAKGYSIAAAYLRR